MLPVIALRDRVREPFDKRHTRGADKTANLNAQLRRHCVRYARCDERMVKQESRLPITGMCPEVNGPLWQRLLSTPMYEIVHASIRMPDAAYCIRRASRMPA
jgi:hypothetical protein